MNRQVLLKSRPVGMPAEDNFEITQAPDPEIKNDGEAILEARFISVDPYMRGRMNDAKSYVPPYQLDEPISGGMVAKVLESNDSKFKEGDFVLGRLPWIERQTAKTEGLTKVDDSLAPLGYYLGILGMPGLTAYFGLLDIGRPEAGETVVVSGGAGAVGSVVGQIAKIKGCHVVGIAGSDEKVRYMIDDLHFDQGINYHKTSDMKQTLDVVCPYGVDVYFDNVGGEISDAVLSFINNGARIVICGQIALYNATQKPVGPRIQPVLLTRRSLMQGFIVGDYAPRFEEGMQTLAKWVNNGKLAYKQTVVQGFENLPKAFLGLFKGENIGKYLVEV